MRVPPSHHRTERKPSLLPTRTTLRSTETNARYEKMCTNSPSPPAQSLENLRQSSHTDAQTQTVTYPQSKEVLHERLSRRGTTCRYTGETCYVFSCWRGGDCRDSACVECVYTPPPPPPSCRTYQIADSVCHSACNNAANNYDGGDCKSCDRSSNANIQHRQTSNGWTACICSQLTLTVQKAATCRLNSVVSITR